MDFGAETCGLPPDFRLLRKAAALYTRFCPLKVRYLSGVQALEIHAHFSYFRY
jgi:hypothetical protein